MKEKIITVLKALGLIKDEDVTKVTTELDKLDLEKAPVVDASKMQDAGLKTLVESIQSEIAILRNDNKQLRDALAEEKTARTNAIQAQKDAAKIAQDKKITDAVDAAIKGGKYPEAKREWLKARFEKDFEGMEEIVKAQPVDKHFKKDGETKDGETKDSENALKSPLETASPLLTKVKEFAKVSEN